MNKKSILFILHLPPPVHGAAIAGKYIAESNAIKSNFETTFINLSTSASLADVGKGGFQKILSLLRLQAKILNTLLKGNYNLCYLTLTASGFGFYKDFSVVLLLKLFRKKIIYHFHNKGVSSNKGFLTGILYRICFSKTKSILLSKQLVYDIEKYVSPENIFICPNGIPSTELRSVSEHINGNDSSCNFLFLSNMLQEKGVFILLEACSILKQKNSSFTCHFAGPWADITEKSFNEKVQQLNIDSCIIHHGKKYGLEKERLLADADVFVFPTYYHNECFPLVLLEAMQFSLPVISTFEGGIRDIVTDGETGFLVPQKNAHQLALKMEELILDKERRTKMGAKGFEKYKNNFTIEHFENKLVTILNEASC
jgi:glycosyltransferase involved in cell wall biosynthesis